MTFKAWPKIPRLSNEVYHFTEKLDGTNAAIHIHEYEPAIHTDALYISKDCAHCLYAQSRTRNITQSDDNFGFAKWALENAEQLITDLGVGYHYGEWWGQGIQRNYGLNHKRFSLFNPTKSSKVCYNVPHIITSKNLDPVQAVIDLMTKQGSYAAPGYMKPEGVIIFAEQSKSYWKVIIDK